ncbi:MAG: GNAT family N-acetyltransferase [Bradyrhizobium sp.]
MTQPDANVPPLITVRRLDAHDAAAYRDLRLEGLKNHPEAFGSSWQDETGKPDAWWAERLEASTVFGGWIGDSPLLGVAGFRVHAGAKHRHKGELWGMYVRPEARGTGLAARLVQRVIEHATPLVEAIGLTVVASNTAGKRLYSAAGFEPYGMERRGLKVGDEYFDEVLMSRSLRAP